MENILNLLKNLIPVLITNGFKVEFDEDLDGDMNYLDYNEGIEPVVFDDHYREEWSCQLFFDSDKDHIEVMRTVLGESLVKTYCNGEYVCHKWTVVNPKTKKEITVLTWIDSKTILVVEEYTKS